MAKVRKVYATPNTTWNADRTIGHTTWTVNDELTGKIFEGTIKDMGQFASMIKADIWQKKGGVLSKANPFSWSGISGGERTSH